jgi:hypothetical protein
LAINLTTTLNKRAIMHSCAFALAAAALASCEAAETKSVFDDSACVLHAYYDSGVGGCSLTLWKDSTCQWSAGFDESQKGFYSISDSIITLKGIEQGGALKSKRLLITKKNPHQLHRGNEILLQIDQTGAVADSIFILTVDKDIRRKL